MRPDLSAMDTLPPSPGSTVAFEKTALDTLIATLRQRGYTVVGPTVRDDAIVYDEIGGVTDLPIGYVDEQEAGTYRLRRWEKDTFFAYTVGPYAWKKFLYPPEERLWEVRRENGTLRFTEAPLPTEQYAFIGVRGCELAAIRIQDRIFTGGPYVDPRYQARRERLFILAVNCTRAGNTCFCASVGSGPQAESPYDIALTELDEVFIAHVGSVLGGQILAEVPHRPAPKRSARPQPNGSRPQLAPCDVHWTPPTCETCCSTIRNTPTGRTWLHAASRAPTAPWYVPPASASRWRT